MASSLNTKINSYAIENGIEFDFAYQIPPIQTGTVSASLTSDWSLSGRQPVYESTVGPNGGSGSWKFVNDSSNGCRVRNNAGSIISRLNDQDFSTGVWVRFNSLPTGLNTSTTFMTFGPGATAGSNFGYKVFADGSTPKFTVLTSGSTFIDVADIQLNTWYYVASRRASGTLTYYINAQAVHSEARTSTANGSFIDWNNSSTNAASINLSNFYIAGSSVIGPTEISEIWTVGSTAPVTVNYSASPMTASADSVDVSLKIDDIFSTTPATVTALMTEPTIIVTSGDSTYVTTSFIGSALFPPNYAVVANVNKNLVITETLNASAELINNISIVTGSDESFGANEFTASAEMVEPILARQPMTASALMGNHSAIVQASYFNLVNSLNPYLYINNGQSAANIVNYGYQSGTFVKGSDLLTNQTAPFPLNLVAEGKSWKGSNSYNSDGFITFETTNFADSFNNLLGTGNFAYEVWVNPQLFPDATGASDDDASVAILNSEKIKLILEDFINQDPPTPDTLRYISLKINNSASTTIELTTPLDSSPLTLNNWNHIVINVHQSSPNPNLRLVQLFINGQVIFNQNISFTTWTDNTDKVNFILGSNATQLEKLSDMYYDELAIYSEELTNSQIIQHYNFISTLSPNYIHNASAIISNAESGDHQFIVTSNVDAIATAITASADFAMPSVLATKVINYSAPALTASALNTDVTVYYGWTIYADFAIAAAEAKEGFALNTTYYDYIQANIAPYRYVTFDTATPFADYGTDTDYAVNPTVVGGIIVNPDIGITGKSAKTAGLDYTTDGVILKESEHDDNWGTGNNSWHSSFWMERAIDDNSTTGLRVLWNLNGHNDDQNVILYHYQNKVHLQINNQVDAPITITSANNISLFDYTRHNIVIRSHHNNNNNHLYVYVDAMLVLDQNIGSYAVTTINNPIHVGANSEANNFPRLGVGCLITPFVDTALPVVPANTKLILDEIYWDKNDINQTQVTNIFNVMPDKVNANTVAEPLTASAQMVMPTIITTVNFVAAPATASAEFANPSLYIERFIVTSADIMDASALMGNAIGFVQISINADVMVASAIFDNPGVIITIPAATMYANAITKYETLLVRGRLTYDYISPWVKYLRATDTISILPTREVM